MTAPRKSTAQRDLALPMQEGVHLRLPEAAYFDARAIGSSDLKTLYWDPWSWWFASDYNAERRVKVKQTRRTALDLGSALHTLVLEGEEAYRSRYVTEPDSGSSRYAHNRKELKALLEQHGHELARGAFTQAELNLAARRAGLAHRYWPTAYARYEQAKSEGLRHVSADEDRRLRHTAHLITTHEELGPALTLGGLSEVSVFWRRDDDPDTLMRARFDKLRVRRIFDIKTIGNWKGRDIDQAIREAIDHNDYDIQRRLYDDAFRALVGFVREGRVHAWNPDGEPAPVIQEERGYLNQIADAGAPVWMWVFVQIRVDDVGRERAPGVWPRAHRPAGDLWDKAGVKIEEGLSAYRRLKAEFTLDRPWAFVDQARELTDGDVTSRTKRRESN